MSRRPRIELLTALIEGQFPVEPIRMELVTYPWDLDDPLVFLRPTHVRSILSRFLNGDLTAASVAAWAEAVELRDDIDYEDEERHVLGEAIFVLANPDVNGHLTPERAEAMLVGTLVRERPNDR
jgi:hypothetical protein